MTSFCCGCPLQFGVCIVIFLNLVQNVFYICTATMNIILRIPTVGANEGLIAQTFNAAWCMIGIPFIFAAIWGVVYKQEANVRLYLFYMCVSLFLDIFYVVAFLATTDLCINMPTALKQHGTAFACGFMRLSGLSFILLMFVFTIYFVFTVWSYCEDLKAGGCGQGFPALLANAGEMRIKRRQAYMSFGPTFGGYGNADSMAFGSVQGLAPGMGGGQIDFDGPKLMDDNYHETSYPPSKNW